VADEPAKASPQVSGIGVANASGFGGACAVVIILIYHVKGIDFPAGMESALAVIFSTLTAYARIILAKVTGVSVP
jgi:hypothetical protein